MANCINSAIASLAKIAAAFTAIVLAGCAGGPAQVNLPGDESDPGRQMYIVKCSKCHKFYDPAKYSSADWTVWMEKMSRKAKLTLDQEKEVGNYIDTNLRKAQADHSSPVP